MPDSIERTLVLTVWSFGNNLRDYLWGKKTEKEKLLVTRALFSGNTGTQLDGLYSYVKNETTISGKYTAYHKWRRNRFERLEQLERLQQLEHLQQLEKLQQLKYSVLDYRSLDIKPSDVVYCDPPYIGTNQNYGEFDDDDFKNWLAKCPAKQIYISEYTQLPHTEVAFILGKKLSFQAKGKRPDELLLKYVK